jgi:predicted RNase H-like nuclease (RuvC/YqgF family)
MIPAGNVDTFTTNLRSLGKITNSNHKTEDVTDSYFDTQIRIKNLEAEIDTMRKLLQKPGWKVSEILEIEREIRRLTDELESLKGYITNLDRQITYSEVRISFEKSQIAIDSISQDSLGYKLQLSLRSGINLLVNIVTAILRFIAFILPISPFAIIAYFILRKPYRRFYKKGEKEPKQ